MKKILLIVGGKSTGLEIREVVDQYYNEVFDEVFNVIGVNESSCKYSFIKDDKISLYFDSCNIELYYILSMSNHNTRNKFINKFDNKKITPFNVIHPESMVSKSVSLGRGIYIPYGVIISSFAKINDHCMLNYSVIIGHDAIVEKNSILNPGCKISGNVIIGENVLVGSNTLVKQGLNIGKNVLIDAMCYIERDLEPNKMYRNKTELKEFKNIFR